MERKLHTEKRKTILKKLTDFKLLAGIAALVVLISLYLYTNNVCPRSEVQTRITQPTLKSPTTVQAVIDAVRARYQKQVSGEALKFAGSWDRGILALDLPQLEEAGFHVEPIHFYGAIPDMTNLDWGALPKDLPGVHLDADYMLSTIRGALTDDCYQEFNALPQNASATKEIHEYHHSMGFTNPADASFQYCWLRKLKPKRMIEIGSGVTTQISAMALTRNMQENGVNSKFTAIEPYPNKVIAAGFPGLTNVYSSKVEDVPLEVFEELNAGDVLFVDSSHVLRLGNDVFYEYLQIIPRLKPGVHVHIHDIFWPNHYTEGMYKKEGRFYTEQYLLQAYLSHNPHWNITYLGNYLSIRNHIEWRNAIKHSNVPVPTSVLADALKEAGVGGLEASLANTQRRSRSSTLWMVGV